MYLLVHSIIYQGFELLNYPAFGLLDCFSASKLACYMQACMHHVSFGRQPYKFNGLIKSLEASAAQLQLVDRASVVATGAVQPVHRASALQQLQSVDGAVLDEILLQDAPQFVVRLHRNDHLLLGDLLVGANTDSRQTAINVETLNVDSRQHGIGNQTAMNVGRSTLTAVSAALGIGGRCHVMNAHA